MDPRQGLWVQGAGAPPGDCRGVCGLQARGGVPEREAKWRCCPRLFGPLSRHNPCRPLCRAPPALPPGSAFWQRLTLMGRTTVEESTGDVAVRRSGTSPQTIFQCSSLKIRWIDRTCSQPTAGGLWRVVPRVVQTKAGQSDHFALSASSGRSPPPCACSPQAGQCSGTWSPPVAVSRPCQRAQAAKFSNRRAGPSADTVIRRGWC